MQRDLTNIKPRTRVDSSWIPNVPLSWSYVASSLKENEVVGYKAAALLVVARLPQSSSGASLHALVGVEDRLNEQRDASEHKSHLFLNIPGGRRYQVDDGPAETALRKFVHETGSVLNESQKTDILKALRDISDTPSEEEDGNVAILWNKSAKLVMYIYHLPFPVSEHLVNLPEAHKARTDRGDEMDKLYWLPLATLVEGLQASARDTITSECGDTIQVGQFQRIHGNQNLLARYLKAVERSDDNIPPAALLNAPPEPPANRDRAPHHGYGGRGGGRGGRGYPRPYSPNRRG